MDTPRPQLLDFQFHQNNDSLTLRFQGRLILTHSKDNPCLWIGSGIADIDMFRGNFSIKDKLQEKIALTDATVSQSPDGWLIHFSRGSDISATLNISADDQGRLLLELQNDNLNHNRIWLRLAAQPEDHIYGCGEQFSYFDLRGKPFPLWTSEQGVWSQQANLCHLAGRLQRERGRRLLLDFLPTAYVCQHAEVLLPC